MINICLSKKEKLGKRYKSLLSKYNASEEALDHALYSWANANESTIRKDGIDLNNPSLEKYLNRHFKTESNYEYDPFFDDGVKEELLEDSLQQNKTYGVDKVEELFYKYSSNKELQELAQKVFKIAKQLGLKVSFLHKDLGFNVGGVASNDTIRYSHIATLSRNKGKLADVLLHEVIHSVTLTQIDAFKNGDLKDAKSIEAVKTILEVYDQVKKDPSLFGEYGLTNEKELIAELANPMFRAKLKKVNLWTRIKEAIKSLLGITTADQSLSKALDYMLDNFDFRLWNEYNVNDNSLNPDDWNFKRYGNQFSPVRKNYNRIVSAINDSIARRVYGSSEVKDFRYNSDTHRGVIDLALDSRGVTTIAFVYDKESSKHLLYHIPQRIASQVKEDVNTGVNAGFYEYEDKTNTYTDRKAYEKTLALWEHFNTKQEWRNPEKAAAAYRNRVKVFGEENVVMYTTPEGKTVVRVAKPTMEESNLQQELEEALLGSSEDLIELAEQKLARVREKGTSRVKFDSKTHSYIVYDSAEDKRLDTGGHRAVSVTQYLYGRKDIGLWGIPSSALGNTTDAITRDFFKESLRKSYPNVNAKQLKAIIQDLETLKKHLMEVHGDNFKVVTDEFPIVATYTITTKGEPEVKYMAGTMDMLVIDELGKFHIYDMKAKRSGMKAEDRVNYGNQLGLYRSILESYGLLVASTNLLHFSTFYENPNSVEYTIDSEGQLYVDGLKKIQDVKGYSSPRLAMVDNASGAIIPVHLDTNNEKMIVEFEALSDPEKELMEEEIGTPTPRSKTSSIEYGKGRESAKSGLYNPMLSASERKFLADQVMQNVSFLVSGLQRSKDNNKGFFGDKFATQDFTSMSREDIISTVGIGELFNFVKEKIIANAMLNASNISIEQKLGIAYDFFNDLVNEGYSKLITLEGVTVVNKAEDENLIVDTGDANTVEDNDTGSLEEKEREYWQLGQRQLSAKSNLSKEIRRMFERLKVLDKNGRPVKDSFGFGLDTFVDSNTAVNNILNWCSDCTTIEEMEEILSEKADSSPYLNTILEKIQDEPIRSLFFKNFRKDFTQYSIIRAEKDSNGNTVYAVHTINTKGATDTILKSLTVAFQTASMQDLIITKDDVEGKGKVNVKNVEALVKEKDAIVKRIHEAFGSKKRLSSVFEKESANIAKLLNDLGIQVLSKTVLMTVAGDTKVSNIAATKSMQLLDKAGHILSTLLDNRDSREYNPMLKAQKEGNLYNTYKALVSIMSKNIEDSIEASTYENGKMYYSFVTPSYMGKLITNLSNAIGNDDKFKAFMRENYANYKWFAEREQNGDISYRCPWLKLLTSSPDVRRMLDHKVQLNFGKVAYDELSELGYTMSLMQEYFYDKGGKWAWYRLPILANKPSSEFVRFKRYSGKNYKRDIKKGLKDVFDQEVLRMRTVLERAVLGSDSGVNKISNYDIDLKLLQKVLGENRSKALAIRMRNRSLRASDIVDIMDAMRTKNKHSGAEFRFLDMLNTEFRQDTELGSMIVDLLNRMEVNEAKLDELLVGTNNARNEDGAFDKYMAQIVEEEVAKWQSIGLFDTNKVEKKDKTGKVTSTTEMYKYLHQLGSTRGEIEDKLTEYVWNDMFATINLIELTVTDLAYYKNMEDFQKRYAQVHSPALKLNASAEWNGVPVSDGNLRTLYLRDYGVRSEVIPNVKAIFDRKIASVTNKSEREAMKRTRDLILSSFEKDLNVTDAQGYSSPTSYRKKMIMAGSWDENMEEAYNRIRSGNYNVNDLNVVWQPLKPFVYSQITKTTGVDAMSEIKVPVQNKNSEYMLLIADALMRSEGQRSTLGAIFDFMEESAYDEDGSYNGKGIDTIQFESAVKSGLMGIIDINDMDYDKIKSTLSNAVYYNSDKSESTDNDMDRYNDQFVHTIPIEDYGIQQGVPAHMADHFQAMGSQVRILSVSDISAGAMFDVHNKGTWDRDHLVERYQTLIAENIKASFDQLARDLNLVDKKGKPITNRKLRSKALSEIMVDAIKKDQRYGADLLRACSLYKNGEFIIPPNDPIQSQRIQQLINSIIKTRINKQKVQGGPVVQASIFGASEDLHIVFNDKNGKPLRTKRVDESDAEYQKYVLDNQGSLSHMEVYMPIPSKALERALTKPDGSIMDVEEAVSKGIMPEEMLKAIGYRIPTEDKYSMIPMKIKGFLPKVAGEVLMMPKEITLLTGSDFDIDKIYVMLKEFTPVTKTNIEGIKRKVLSSYKKKYGKGMFEKNKDFIDSTLMELYNGREVTDSSSENKVLLKQLKSIYDQLKESHTKQTFVEKTAKSREEATISTRNNEIFDIQWSVLTNEDTMSKMFNPGSFDIQKKTARIVKALKAGVHKSYRELSAMTLDELDALATSTTSNIILSSTQVAFHKQNMTAGKLIGIFANNNTSHAFLSMQHIHLNLSADEAFTIDGKTVSESENNELDRQQAFDGSLISKNIAGFLAASVDAVKDPVLNFMNLNTFTAGPAMVLARLGFDSDSIGLLLTQPIIEKVSREYFRQNNDGYVTVEDIIEQELDNSFKNWRVMEQNVAATDFTKESLVDGILQGTSTSEDQAMILLLFRRLAGIAKNVNTLTFLTKFNSVTNAVGPTIADTLVMRERYNKFLQLMEAEKAPFSNNAVNVIDNSPILKAFYETTVGDRGASRLIFEPFFPQYSPKFTELLNLLRSTTKAGLDSKTINKLINDFTLYKLTAGNDPIINSEPEQRDRFINQFVKEFRQRAEGIVDNELINIITAEPSGRNCPVPTLNVRTGGYNADQQERIKAAWSSLMEDPETFELGRDLFIYNLYRNGFTFSPKTFLHLASVDTKLSMGGYIDAISSPSFNDESVSIADFLLQFRRNHSQDSKLVPTLKPDKRVKVSANTVGGKTQLTITFDRNKSGLEAIIANRGKSETTFVPVIWYNNKLYYAIDSIPRGNSITYTQTTPLGNINNFLEYNANETASSMETVLGKKAQATEKSNISVPSRSDDSVNHNQGETELTPKDIDFLFNEGPLSSYYKEITQIAREGGEDVATSKTLDLIEQKIGETNKKKVKEKFEEILKRFCRI